MVNDPFTVFFVCRWEIVNTRNINFCYYLFHDGFILMRYDNTNKRKERGEVQAALTHHIENHFPVRGG